jgi:hypothetical protein
MTNKNRFPARAQALRRAATLVDRLIMLGFATSVMVVMALFFYILSSGGLPSP